ncbi:MAG: hypothetical protein K0S55_773 [Clostridia bacterium]|nr:hypothetical protein [Clostridia bacterium]
MQIKKEKFKAIFFDRDGTLTYYNPIKKKWLADTVKGWSGIDFELPYEKMMNIFNLASEGKTPWYKNVDDEREFNKRYYYYLLIEEGVTEDLKKKAELLFSEIWCNNDRLLYPETVEVLEYFYNKNYKMGVISDTSPSLEYTLQQLGISKYFGSFTASSLVGVGKPNPIIYNAALNSLNVTAKESIYIDDYDIEADGARDIGMTAFWLDRSGISNKTWTVKNLNGIIEYVENLI